MFSDTPLLQPIRPRQHFHVVHEEQIQTLAKGTLEISSRIESVVSDLTVRIWSGGYRVFAAIREFGHLELRKGVQIQLAFQEQAPELRGGIKPRRARVPHVR